MPAITVLDKSHDRTGFDCGVQELNIFLKATARQHGTKGISRTFVLTDGTPVILGYVTLTLCEVESVQLPATLAHKYPIHPLPAVRLARLAVSRKSQGKGFGELLLSEALYRTAVIAEQAGVIGLFVDAKNDAAHSFYLRYGFLALPEQPLKLFLPIESILNVL
ncbi:MAG: GNAT family N-acetyltransferase [Desulfuromonadaceae bacterium]|nr:GNAT family N-acetyltransferase [Desulfuromonadaceae bacterium]